MGRKLNKQSNKKKEEEEMRKIVRKQSRAKKTRQGKVFRLP